MKFSKINNGYLREFCRINICLAAVVACVLVIFTGCGKKNQVDNVDSEVSKRDYDLFVYNGDKSISKDFSDLCEIYTKKTGTVVKCVTPGNDEDADELLKNYMSTELPPSIFSVTGMDELKQWQEEGKIFDFSNAAVEDFKAVANAIPGALRLSSNNVDNFGIPYTVEGFGLIVDPKMISSLFGGEYHRAILRDLENCSFDEFEGFVNAVKLYIAEGRIYEFQLCGHNYGVLNKKSGLSQDLNGIFSASYGDTALVSNLFNVFLNRFFTSAASVRNASKTETSDIQPSLRNFFKMLDVLTSCVSGKTSTLYRSAELVDTKANSRSQSIKNFVAGNSLFLIGKTTDFKAITALDSDLASRLDFIPLKCLPKKLITDVDSQANDFDDNSNDDAIDSPLASSESVADKKMNASLAVDVPRYFSINSAISDTDMVKAQEFLAWLKTSDVAQDYIVNKFGFVPYDISDSKALSNSLDQSLSDYLRSTKILPYVAYGLNSKFRTDTLPNYLIKNCLNDPLWEAENYDDFSEGIMKIWNTD